MSTGEYQDRTFQLTETEEIRYYSPHLPFSPHSAHCFAHHSVYPAPPCLTTLSILCGKNISPFIAHPILRDTPLVLMAPRVLPPCFLLLLHTPPSSDDRYSLIYRLPSMVITPHSVATILKDEDGSNSSHLSHVLHSALTKSNTKQNSAMGTQRCSEALPASHNPERETVPNTSDQDAPTEEHLKILSEFTDEGYGSPETNEEVQVRIGAESFHTTVGTLSLSLSSASHPFTLLSLFSKRFHSKRWLW
jgi:hypothetical protein